MKKAFVLLCFSLTAACAFAADGVESDGYYAKKYFNLAIAKSTLKQEDAGLSMKGKIGFSLSTGRTYYVTGNLLNFMKVGIDATWFDLTFRQYGNGKFIDALMDEYEDYYDDYYYDDYYDYYDEDDDDGPSFPKKVYELGIGMQVGPSITFNPVKKLDIHVYLRWAPSFVGLLGNDLSNAYGFASAFTSGCSVTWRGMGVGIEGKFGPAKLNNLVWDNAGKVKTKTNGFRFFLNFGF